MPTLDRTEKTPTEEPNDDRLHSIRSSTGRVMEHWEPRGGMARNACAEDRR